MTAKHPRDGSTIGPWETSSRPGKDCISPSDGYSPAVPARTLWGPAAKGVGNVRIASLCAAAGGGGDTFSLVSILPLILIFVVFYFLLIRPQQKKMKDHKAMIEGVRRGDRVVTTAASSAPSTR